MLSRKTCGRSQGFVVWRTERSTRTRDYTMETNSSPGSFWLVESKHHNKQVKGICPSSQCESKESHETFPYKYTTAPGIAAKSQAALTHKRRQQTRKVQSHSFRSIVVLALGVFCKTTIRHQALPKGGQRCPLCFCHEEFAFIKRRKSYVS